MADYGTDVSTFPDLDVTGRGITGPRVVAECTLRRLTTAAGSLEYDKDFGYDVRELLNEDLSDIELRREQARIAMEVEKDERVASADVRLVLDRVTMKLFLHVGGSLYDGKVFRFVLAIDKVSAAVLEAA
jgi:hypothetical protein